MNAEPLASDWARIVGVLGAEVGLLAALLWAGVWAWPPARRLSAIWARTLWRGGVAGALLLLGLELAGVRPWLGGVLEGGRGDDLPSVEIRTNFEPTFQVAPGEEISKPPVRPAIREIGQGAGAVWWPGAAWLLGTLLLLGRGAWARGVLAAVLWRRGRPEAEEMQRRVRALAKALGIQRRVQVRRLDGLPGPVACGRFVPTIVLPVGFGEEHSKSAQEAMLTHELAHIAARDAWWQWLGDLAAALLWWHPVVWWLRGQMLAASEWAADEASREIKGGPQVLAECLVAMARRWVSSPAAAGWQGVHGGHFRSGLGRRVERLLRDDAAAWHPVSGARRWLGRGAVLLLLAGVSMAAAWMVHRDRAMSWRESWGRSMGSLLWTQVRAADGAEGTTQPVEERIPWQPWSRESVDAALASGRTVLVFFTADWAVAAQVNEQVALEVPAVRRRLRELDALAFKADWTQPNAAIEAELKAFGRTTVPLTVVASRAFGAKRAVLPEVLTAEIVVRALDGMVSSQGAEARGEDAVGAAPTTPAPPSAVTSALFEVRALVNAGKWEEAEAKVRSILATEPDNLAAQHYMRMVQERMRSSLVSESATNSIEVRRRESVRQRQERLLSGDETSASATAPALAELASRWFLVDQKLVGKAVAERLGTRRRPLVMEGRARVTEAEQLVADLRNYFGSFGIEVTAGGRSLFLSDTRGMLMVRATPQELATIERAILELNTPPPQFVIESKFVEIPAESWNGLALDWLVEWTPPTNANMPSGLFGPGYAHVYASSRGILAQNGAEALFRAMERRAGVDVLSAPKVTTLTDRQAQIKVVTVRTVVTRLQSPAAAGARTADPVPVTATFEAGPVLDVVPHVADDHMKVSLTIIASVKEFVGYDSAAPKSEPRPVYRWRRLAGGVNLWDGQTAVLRDGEDTLEVLRDKDAVGEAPEIGEEFQRRHAEMRARSRLVVLVTATLIDAAGNRLHRDEDIPLGFPKQGDGAVYFNSNSVAPPLGPVTRSPFQ